MAVVVLIAAGILGWCMAVSVETVNIPIWAGVRAIVIGGALLLVGGKKGESRLSPRG